MAINGFGHVWVSTPFGFGYGIRVPKFLMDEFTCFQWARARMVEGEEEEKKTERESSISFLARGHLCGFGCRLVSQPKYTSFVWPGYTLYGPSFLSLFLLLLYCDEWGF